MEEKSECKGMAGGNFYAVGIVYLVGGDGYKNVCVKTQRLGRARGGLCWALGLEGSSPHPEELISKR